MFCRASMILSVMLVPCLSGAAELNDLTGHDGLFGRYAPGGDCNRKPQIAVDKSGIAFEVAGKTEKVTRVEQALGYYGPDYQGIQEAIFPFTRPDGEYAIIMHFNYAEKPGALVIEGHGEGYPGGPPFSPRNQALAAASPYARCQPK